MKAAIVSTLSGEAYVERDGQRIALQEGSELSKSDVVRTEAGAKIEIRFVDDSIIELGPSTQVSIRDFAFDPAGQSEPSFALHMMGGVVRSISGKIVEQNPESFKLTSPLGAVGIRGTETLHVIGDTEIHSVINLGYGHDVVITMANGQSIILTQALTGISYEAGSTGPLQQLNLTPEMLNQYLQQVSDVANQNELAEGESPRGWYIVADEAVLTQMDVPTVSQNVAFVSQEQLDTLISALEESGLEEEALEIVSDILETPLATDGPDSTYTAQAPVVPGALDESDADSGDAPLPPADGLAMLPTPGDSTTGDDTVVLRAGDEFNYNGLDGNDSFTHYGSITGSVVQGGMGNDTIQVLSHPDVGPGDFTTGAVSGDENELNGQTGGNDSIYIQGNVSGGNIAGDSITGLNNTVTGSDNTISIGGNDSIKIGGSVSGGYIAGDAAGQINGSKGGNDNITVEGDFSYGVLSGDAATNMNGVSVNSVNIGSLGGNDTIIIGGEISGGALLVGDAQTINGSSQAGNDVIKVGSMSGGEIYGDAKVINLGSAGRDSITVSGNMSGGEIYGDSQSAGASASNFGGNTISIGGSMSGGDIYATTGGQNSGAANSISIGSYEGGTIHMAGDTTLTIGSVNIPNGEINFSAGSNEVVKINGISGTSNSSILMDDFDSGDSIILDGAAFSSLGTMNSTISLDEGKFTIDMDGGKSLILLFDNALSSINVSGNSSSGYTITTAP